MYLSFSETHGFAVSSSFPFSVHRVQEPRVCLQTGIHVARVRGQDSSSIREAGRCSIGWRICCGGETRFRSNLGLRTYLSYTKTRDDAELEKFSSKDLHFKDWAKKWGKSELLKLSTWAEKKSQPEKPGRAEQLDPEEEKKKI